jgi:hypothetical protein
MSIFGKKCVVKRLATKFRRICVVRAPVHLKLPRVCGMSRWMTWSAAEHCQRISETDANPFTASLGVESNVSMLSSQN